jgi:hypothetical protein
LNGIACISYIGRQDPPVLKTGCAASAVLSEKGFLSKP